jgi:phenylacetate-CoA ligase
MFRSLDDLANIPVLSKQRLKAAQARELVAQGSDPARCTVVHTSGSTGTPLQVYLGATEQRWQRVAAWRILFEHGFCWSDRTLEIRMTPGPRFAVQRLGVAPKDWLSILDSPESWARCLTTRRHEVVVASASTLHALAEAVEALGVVLPRPRLVISDSEPLTPATRYLVNRVLGTPPIDVYGLVELSNFAWECEYRNGFHISADSHIVEVNSAPGEVGPLLATALGMWTMPIIRYQTGDLAELTMQPCACGRTLPRLQRLYGRATESVVLPDGRRLFWPFFHEVLGAFQELRQWRVIQEESGRLRVQLLPATDAPELFARLTNALRQAVPATVELSLERVDAIPITPGEKVRMVLSRVSPPTGQTVAVGIPLHKS